MGNVFGKCFTPSPRVAVSSNKEIPSQFQNDLFANQLNHPIIPASGPPRRPPWIPETHYPPPSDGYDNHCRFNNGLDTGFSVATAQVIPSGSVPFSGPGSGPLHPMQGMKQPPLKPPFHADSFSEGQSTGFSDRSRHPPVEQTVNHFPPPPTPPPFGHKQTPRCAHGGRPGANSQAGLPPSTALTDETVVHAITPGTPMPKPPLPPPWAPSSNPTTEDRGFPVFPCTDETIIHPGWEPGKGTTAKFEPAKQRGSVHPLRQSRDDRPPGSIGSQSGFSRAAGNFLVPNPLTDETIIHEGPPPVVSARTVIPMPIESPRSYGGVDGVPHRRGHPRGPSSVSSVSEGLVRAPEPGDTARQDQQGGEEDGNLTYGSEYSVSSRPTDSYAVPESRPLQYPLRYEPTTNEMPTWILGAPVGRPSTLSSDHAADQLAADEASVGSVQSSGARSCGNGLISTVGSVVGPADPPRPSTPTSPPPPASSSPSTLPQPSPPLPPVLF